MTLRAALLASALSMTVLAGGPRADAQSPPPARETPPGEGVICVWGLLTIASEVASRCFPTENSPFHAELRNSVARVDAYVAANSADFTPDEAAKFKQTQGLVGAPRERVCSAGAIQIYHAFERGGAMQLRSNLDAALAKPGKPTWGTCL